MVKPPSASFSSTRASMRSHRCFPVALMASPSTCVQFAPGSAGFKADDQPPGYRWLELRADGSIETAVSRVTDAEFFVELDSGGYL